MDNLNTKEAWAHRDAVVDHLSGQLAKGRLALFLGAGVSAFYGLPDWDTLVARLCAMNGEGVPAKVGDPIDRIEALRIRHYKGRAPEFLKDVWAALYEGVALDFETLRSNRLLSAIGSLAMASKRGSASKIITLNYDDLLELYLEYHGFVVDSIHVEKHWVGGGDVTIHHPHGLLPLEATRPGSDAIVLGTRDYLHVMGQDSLWKPVLQSIMRTHTTLYIGLSGSDRHQQQLVEELTRTHAAGGERLAYHGVRFATERGEDAETIMEDFGVHTQVLGSWDELPSFLFEICQNARRFRT